MKKIILSVIFLFSIPAYSNCNNEILKKSIQEIQRELGHELRSKFGLYYHGGYAYPYDARMDFVLYSRLSLEEARHLIVHISEKLIERINTDERIQPFLGIKLFPPYNISIEIETCNLVGMLNCDGTISQVRVTNSKISYRAFDAYEKHFCDIHQESYDEAKRIVKSTMPQFPVIHKNTTLESGFDEISDRYTQYMVDNFVHVFNYFGCKKDDQFKRVDAHMTRFKKTKVKQARFLIVKAVEQLLAMVNSNEALCSQGNTSFTADQIRMRINFRNNNGCSFDKNSLESVVLEDGKVTYFEKKHSERTPTLSESYSKAKERVL